MTAVIQRIRSVLNSLIYDGAFLKKKLTAFLLLTILTETSIIDVWQDSKFEHHFILRSLDTMLAQTKSQKYWGFWKNWVPKDKI